MECIIVYNPHSGKGKFVKKLPMVLQKLKLHGIVVREVFQSQHVGSITSFISRAFAENPVGLLIISGGDGTFNEALQAIMVLPVKPRIGYLPSGTANDLAGILGIPKNLMKALDLILQKHCMAMDIGKIGDQYFSYVTGCGKFTSVSYDPWFPKMKRKLGRMYYMLAALHTLPQDASMHVTVVSNTGEVVTGNFFLLLCLNAQRVGGFHYQLRIPAKLNDGEMELVLFQQKRVTFLFHLVRFFMFGDYIRGGFQMIRGSEFSVTIDKEVCFNVDGEKNVCTEKVKIQVLPKALHIYASPKKIKLFEK